MHKLPYLAYPKILHLLDQTIVIIFQHSSILVYIQSSIMSTSLSEACAMCGKSFKRLGAPLVCSLACGSYYMPCHADTDEFRGNAGSNVSHSTLFRAHCATGWQFRPRSKIACDPQNMGQLPEISNRGHHVRKCPVPRGTVLFDSLVATLPATSNPPSTG